MNFYLDSFLNLSKYFLNFQIQYFAKLDYFLNIILMIYLVYFIKCLYREYLNLLSINNFLFII